MPTPAESSFWLPANAPLPENIIAGCTTRFGGASTGCYAEMNLATHVHDETALVQANRDQLQQFLGANAMQWLEQIHSAKSVPSAPGTTPAADATWTMALDVALNILTADCVPVLLWRVDGGVVGAAHAGWRGLQGGVLDAVLTQMPGPNADYSAWLGPCISPTHYEVGADVWQHFVDTPVGVLQNHKVRDKRYLDLPQLATEQLQRLGVGQVYASGWCSFDDARFYSHRRSGGAATGRMASTIMRRSS